MSSKQIERWSPLVLLLVLVALWQGVCVLFAIPEFIFPAPTQIAQAMGEFSGPIAEAAWKTFWVTMVGFGISIVVGVLLGFLVGSSRLAYAAVYPLLVAFNAVPKAAIVPILIVWFGIGVGPVAVAEYLDRPNLVVQQTSNQLGVAESHRWAGDISQGISRVMAANLGRQMKSGNVRVYPWQRDDEINYQVTLDVRQLHSGEDGYAVIEVGWRVYSFPDKRLKVSKTFVDREPLESGGYGPMVAAESRLLARLAKDIASGLR